jgi:hypothetical protein
MRKQKRHQNPTLIDKTDWAKTQATARAKAKSKTKKRAEKAKLRGYN